MRRQLIAALGMVVIFTVLTGLIFPLAVTGVAQLLFSDKANGSPIERDGELVGSSLIGQNFTEPEYFHPRPSAAGDGYDGSASSASNKGPTNEEWLHEIEDRVAAYRATNALAEDLPVPVDAVTASASGLDPHISIANARLQAPRVADARGMRVAQMLDLIDHHTAERALGFLGEPGVNVLELNLALDDLG